MRLDQIVTEALTMYRSLKADLGRVPSSREFYKVFSKRLLGLAFPAGRAYSRLPDVSRGHAKPILVAQVLAP